MAFKKLHSFVVELEKEVEKTETKIEDGKKVTTTSTVKEKVPHTILLKSPTRREKQDLSVFHTVVYGKAIEQGMLPKVVVVQKFLKDPDSPLSQEDDKNITKLYSRLDELNNDLVRMNALKETDDLEERKEKLFSEFLSTQKKITDAETAYRSLFAHTAENYAQNRALSWLILHLAYVQIGEEEPYPMFRGKNFNEKEQSLFELDDAEDELFFAASERLSMYASLYFTGSASKPEDFARIEEEYEKQLKAEEDIDRMEREMTEEPQEAEKTETPDPDLDAKEEEKVAPEKSEE